MTMADRLQPGQTLTAGQRISSPNGQYALTLQADGNLVLYTAKGAALWASNTVGKFGARAVLQQDGNFVMYDGAGAAFWATNTAGHSGAFLRVQDDGNVVLYHGTAPIWESTTWGGVSHERTGGSWLTKAVHSTISAPSNLAKAVAHEVSIVAPQAGKFFKDVTQSPYWKIAAGIAPIILPGAGLALTAGMAAATTVGKAASLKDMVIGAVRDQVGTVLGPAAQAGVDVANGVLLSGHPITEEGLNFVRTQVSTAHPEMLAGFDAAAAIHVGRHALVRPPKNMVDPKARGAFYLAQGLRSAPPQIAKAVHTALKVGQDPQMKKGFGVGVKAAKHEHKLEQAQVVLTKMRETMRRVRKNDAQALSSVQTLIKRYHAGDAKAKAAVTMLAIADRANRELDGRLSTAAVVHVGGMPLLTMAKHGGGFVARAATIPFDWLKEVFFDHHHHAAHAA